MILECKRVIQSTHSEIEGSSSETNIPSGLIPVSSHENGPKKKRRRRKNPKWKPYKKMTWEEKKALEEKKKNKIEDRSIKIPTTKDGRIKRGVHLQDYRPNAPNISSEVPIIVEPSIITFFYMLHFSLFLNKLNVEILRKCLMEKR